MAEGMSLFSESIENNRSKKMKRKTKFTLIKKGIQ